MLADSAPPAPSVILAPDVLQKGEQRYALLDFIAKQLLGWKPERMVASRENEDRLTYMLSNHLNRAAHLSEGWSWVHFQTQVPDNVHRARTLDIAAQPFTNVIVAERLYVGGTVLLPIECKRLPTSSGAEREREYVTSPKNIKGGIQRFKFGKHASDHELAAMIGYVQKGQPIDWFTTVNGWIKDLVAAVTPKWSDDDLLQLDEDLGEVCRLSSRHDREANYNAIELRHLWVNLN